MAIQNVTDAYVLAQTAGDTYNGDSSDQTYSINPNLIGAGDTITIIDQGGNNAIELPAGLEITSSQTISDQTILTLSNSNGSGPSSSIPDTAEITAAHTAALMWPKNTSPWN